MPAGGRAGARSSRASADRSTIHDVASPLSPPADASVVATAPTYRAVSVDLWFTALYYPAEREDQWQDDRVRSLAEILRTPDGRRPELSDVRSAFEVVRQRLENRGSGTVATDPGVVVAECAGVLGGTLALPAEEAARIYSSAGLEAHPPSINPEFPELVQALDQRGIPVVMITNTARRGESWQRFFRQRGVSGIRHILASCEVGRAKPDPEIFREAARRVGVPVRELLHVGDRWELDVDGACAAGCGAVLYRGLWTRYPSEEDSPSAPDPASQGGVTVVDRLSEVLDRDLL